NPTVGAIHLSNMVPAQGALPINVGEDTIGAIGVSGAPGGDKDEACAKAGLDKGAADLKGPRSGHPPPSGLTGEGKGVHPATWTDIHRMGALPSKRSSEEERFSPGMTVFLLLGRQTT